MNRWKATNNEMPKESAMFADLYRFYQTFYKGDNSREYWAAVTNIEVQMEREYGRDPLIMAILPAIIDELEHPERRFSRYGRMQHQDCSKERMR